MSSTLLSGENQHHVMRTLKQYYGKVHLAGNRPLANSRVSEPSVGPVKMLVDYNLCQHLDHDLMRDPKPVSPS